jgi:hypothetical protein
MLFKKTKTEEKPRPERIQRMSDHDIVSWLNTCIMEMGPTYDQWAYHRGSANEFGTLLDLTKSLWDELQSR